MATTVDTLLVRIEADMSDLRRDLAKVAKTTEQQTNRMADGFRKVRNAIVAIGGGALFGTFLKSTVMVGAQIEGLEVQLNALLGSAEEGGKAFENMRRFASKVPFSLQQIQQGAGGLAAAAGNADELGELLQLTGNIAAQFNLPFEEAAANVQRALSAGIGAADQFRDRGVSAFAGFEAGVSYSAADQFRDRGVSAFAGFEAGVSYSAAETARKLQAVFGTGGTADGAMDEFAKTTQGALSMLGDAVFNFQAVVAGSGLNAAFIDLTNLLTGLINGSRQFAAVTGVLLGRVLRGVSAIIAKVAENMDTLLFMFAGFAAFNFAMVIGGATKRFIAFAAAIRAAGLASILLNKITRKNILGITFVGAALALAGGKLEAFEGKIAGFFDRAMQALPDKVKASIDDLSDELDLALKAINEAEGKEKQTSPSNIEIGGAGVDTKSLIDLRKTIDSITGGTRSLTEDLEKLKAIGADSDLFVGAQDAIARLEHQLEYETNPAFASFVDSAMALGDGVQSAFRQMLDGTQLTLADFGEMIKSAVKDVVAQIFRLVVINQMLNAMFPGLGLQTSTLPQILGRAGGGSAYGNQPMLVGERGPELFVPHSAGSVMNNASSKGALGGGSTVVNQTINIETGVSQTVRAEMLSLLPVIKADTMNAVADQNRRGGSYRQALA